MRIWGIRNRVLILTLLPTITITILLSIYFTNLRLSDLDQHIRERGVSTAKQLAPASGYGLLSKNKDILQNIANATLNEADVRAVSIYDANQTLFVHSGPNMRQLDDTNPAFPDELTLYTTQDTIRYILPIRTINTLPTSLPQLSSIAPRSQIIGWAALELSFTNTTLVKYQTILTSGLLVLIGFLVNGLIALRISRDISEPILQITHAVARIKDGELDTRVHTGTSGELQILESGINAMAASINNSYDELQQNIDQATEDLRETLETIEIQNIELDIARKEALEASRIKSEFLANMSHEIRTPLNGIIGFSNLIFKTALSDKQHEYMNIIHKSSEGLLTIINDILDFSKIEAGKLVLDNIDFEIKDLISDVLTIVAPNSHEKNLELVSLVYEDVPPLLQGDPLRLKQIITNLVSNAVKFTHQGSVVVRTMLEDMKMDTLKLKISVTDTGIGLSEKQQHELFKAFTQADTSTTRQSGGTGLGLVISKRLAEQMGGDIGLESEPGKGSTFWFSIKVSIATGAIDALSENRLAQQRIMLFEPYEIANNAFAHSLKNWNIDFHSTQTTEALFSALEHAQNTKSPYAALIIGCNFIKTDASKIHELVKKCYDAYQIKILVLANSSDQIFYNALLMHGAQAYLSKPVHHKRLYNTLCALVFQEELAPEVSITPKINIQDKTNRQTPLILAVDDNDANLKLINTLLVDLGCQVHTVDSGSLAITKCQEHRFDLIFMDVQMPNMDGIETTSRIRANEIDGQHTPIIALTAHALAGEKNHLLRSGMDDYIAKPINEQQLQQIIFKWSGHVVQYTSHPHAPTKINSNVYAAVHTHYTYLPENAYHIEHDAPHSFTTSKTLQPIYDEQDGLARASHKANLASDMLQMLLHDLPDTLSEIKTLLKNENYTQLKEVIHKLHGGTQYCGVPKLRDAANTAETSLKLEKTERVDADIEELILTINELLDWSSSM